MLTCSGPFTTLRDNLKNLIGFFVVLRDLIALKQHGPHFA